MFRSRAVTHRRQCYESDGGWTLPSPTSFPSSAFGPRPCTILSNVSDAEATGLLGGTVDRVPPLLLEKARMLPGDALVAPPGASTGNAPADHTGCGTARECSVGRMWCVAYRERAAHIKTLQTHPTTQRTHTHLQFGAQTWFVRVPRWWMARRFRGRASCDGAHVNASSRAARCLCADAKSRARVR